MTKKNDIPKELLDQLLAGYSKPEDLTGPGGLLKRLTGALVERALETEMTEHLGYEAHDPEGRGSGNSRNGKGTKTLKTEQGEIPIDVPRDRNGTFEPKLVKKRQTHFTGFDDRILSMYARGMSQRDIQAHLEEMYGTDVGPDLISRVTDAVVDEISAWQSRPLDPVWPVVWLSARQRRARANARRHRRRASGPSRRNARCSAARARSLAPGVQSRATARCARRKDPGRDLQAGRAQTSPREAFRLSSRRRASSRTPLRRARVVWRSLLSEHLAARLARRRSARRCAPRPSLVSRDRPRPRRDRPLRQRRRVRSTNQQQAEERVPSCVSRDPQFKHHEAGA